MFDRNYTDRDSERVNGGREKCDPTNSFRYLHIPQSRSFTISSQFSGFFFASRRVVPSGWLTYCRFCEKFCPTFCLDLLQNENKWVWRMLCAQTCRPHIDCHSVRYYDTLCSEPDGMYQLVKHISCNPWEYVDVYNARIWMKIMCHRNRDGGRENLLRRGEKGKNYQHMPQSSSIFELDKKRNTVQSSQRDSLSAFHLHVVDYRLWFIIRFFGLETTRLLRSRYRFDLGDPTASVWPSSLTYKAPWWSELHVTR